MISYELPNTPGKIVTELLKYTPVAKADKTIPVLAIPSNVIADASAAGVLVKKGSLLRVVATSAMTAEYLHFGAVNVAAPTVATVTAIQVPTSPFFIVATADYVRTSVAMRIEVIPA